jgi:hypothetical protein
MEETMTTPVEETEEPKATEEVTEEPKEGGEAPAAE